MLNQDINYLKEQQDELLTKYNKLEHLIQEYQDELNKYNNQPDDKTFIELLEQRTNLSHQLSQFRNEYNEYKEMERIVL